MITAEEVSRRIEMYFEGGAVTDLTGVDPAGSSVAGRGGLSSRRDVLKGLGALAAGACRRPAATRAHRGSIVGGAHARGHRLRDADIVGARLLGAGVGRDRGRRDRRPVRGVGAGPRRRRRSRAARARGRARRNGARRRGRGDAVSVGRPLRSRPRSREPRAGRAARGSGRRRRPRCRGAAPLRGRRALPRSAGARVRPRRVVRRPLPARGRHPGGPGRAAPPSRPTCGGGRSGATSAAGGPSTCPGPAAPTPPPSAPSTDSRWTATCATAAGARSACAGSSSTAAATTSARPSPRPRPGRASTTSRRGSATPAHAADFLTWPEGNGRLVSRLAARAGSRIRTQATVRRVTPLPRGVDVVYYDEREGRLRGHPRRARGPRAAPLPRPATSWTAPRRPAAGARLRRVDGREPDPARSARVARLSAGVGQRPLREPVARLRGGHAPAGPRPRADGVHVLPAAARRRPAPRPPAAAGDARGRRWVAAILADLGPAHGGLARPRRDGGRLPVGTRDGPPAAGIAVERFPRRVRPSRSAASTSRTPTSPAWRSSRRRSTGACARRKRSSPPAATGSSPGSDATHASGGWLVSRRTGTSPSSEARPSFRSPSSPGVP